MKHMLQALRIDTRLTLAGLAGLTVLAVLASVAPESYGTIGNLY